MTETEIRILKLLSQHTRVNIDGFANPLELTFDRDLKFDSLDVVMFVMATEEEFSFEISDDEADAFVASKGEGAKTIGDWCNHVETKLAGKVSA